MVNLNFRTLKRKLPKLEDIIEKDRAYDEAEESYFVPLEEDSLIKELVTPKKQYFRVIKPSSSEEIINVVQYLEEGDVVLIDLGLLMKREPLAVLIERIKGMATSIGAKPISFKEVQSKIILLPSNFELIRE